VSVSVLERELYSEAEAARLLRVPQATLHYWLEGGQRRGKSYRPVVRMEPKNSRAVTWAEFVEAGLLAQYRRTHKVPMGELRDFIDYLREHIGVPYPLADRRPFITNRQLVLEAQEAAGLDSDHCLVAWASGQLVLTGPSEEFVQRVKWDDAGFATAWRPHADRKSTVLIDPGVRFGRPSVQGISTEALWEHEEAGEPVEAIAEAFDLATSDVRWALAYENALRAAA
jgi:uncharacterized protein (DUF433 family)